IYKSNDVAAGAYRIPATFVASAAYGAVMALTVPFLVWLWAKPSVGLVRRRFLELALVASGLGVFLSASRTSAILLAISLTGIFTSLRLKTSHRAGLVALVLAVGWAVGKDARLQRFTTLDTSVVMTRVGWS